MKTFIKPQIKFPMFHAIYMYIEFNYNKIENLEDFVEFINHCLNQAETTKNEVKNMAYTKIANALYSMETNVSYESKHIELLVNSL